MPEDHFAGDVARRYDAGDGAEFAAETIEATVDVLADLAGSGDALEFAVGTGRISLPLSARGVTVRGIDLSASMIEILRSKPGAEAIETVQGDIARTRVPGEYSLVFLVFNTIGNLTSQGEQVACFRNAAEHLGPGGRFVIEVGVPDLQRLPAGQRFQPFTVTPDHLGVDEYDVVTQSLISHHYSRIDGAFVQHSVPLRYVWPAELDLMARLAGLTLTERWADWRRSPFTGDSRKHVSVWQKA